MKSQLMTIRLSPEEIHDVWCACEIYKMIILKSLEDERMLDAKESDFLFNLSTAIAKLKPIADAVSKEQWDKLAKMQREQFGLKGESNQ
jgi:hypothetical protein